jgi:hypothetical protein
VAAGLVALMLAAAVLAAACGGTSTSTVASSSRANTGLAEGLIAYATDQGVGVLDPATGKSAAVFPLPAGGAFRVSGPVWGPAPGVAHPVLYFTIHDDRPAERRTTQGVVPYDWLFRVDPFTGAIDPLAASQDSQSEGPLGLVANSHYLALTYGCCTTYEVDALDLTQTAGPLRVLSRPPNQAAFFTEGLAPGASGLIAVRAFGTGAWYWLNADAGVLNPFPLSLGPDDGPLAISADGSMAAIALPDHGALIEPISVAVPVAVPSPSSTAGAPTAGAPTAGTTPTPKPVASATPSAPAAPRHVNSQLPHPDGLAWSPNAKQLALAVNGELDIYSASGADRSPPAAKYLTGGNVSAVSWSAPVPGESLALVKGDPGPQPMVDALLDATKLPAAADTPANRPLTSIYMWQFDSAKASPISAISDATPAVLSTYPPLPAGVVFHHWAPSATWGLLGGCFRYRVLITGSVAPVASTLGLAADTLCSAPKAQATPSAAASPAHSPTP